MLSPVVLNKEFINSLNKKGEQILMSDSFIKDHSVVYWNLVLYFKIMKLPGFILDHDTSQKHLKV
jgi:DENN domain-containing protein 4